jgi:hypothetical protein
MGPTRQLRWVSLAASILALPSSGCGLMGCSRYASDYPCSYVENRADYEVWYWRNVEDDDEDDNKLIGHATGLRMCEDNARAYAATIGDDFNYRSYICILMKNGNRMEKHRLLEE